MTSTSYRFCKAYPAERVLVYPGVQEHLASRNRELTDCPVVYVHDDLVVRAGVFPDDEVIYADTSDDWKQFCSGDLAFVDPYAATVKPQATAG
jgi:hypothetical protein